MYRVNAKKGLWLAWLIGWLSLVEELLFGASKYKHIYAKCIFEEKIYYFNKGKKKCDYVVEHNCESLSNHWIMLGNIIAGGYIFVASFEKYILLIFQF